jgi:hypothetical protein
MDSTDRFLTKKQKVLTFQRCLEREMGIGRNTLLNSPIFIVILVIKIAIGPRRYGHSTTVLFDFLAEEFYDSIYLFTLRDPYDTIVSSRNLLPECEVRDICESMLLAYLLLVRIIRNFPNVRMLFLEQIDRAQLLKLGELLGVELQDAGEYYNSARINRYAAVTMPEEMEEIVATLTETYSDLKSIDNGEAANSQLEQKEGAAYNSNPNLLGRIYNRCTALAEQIAQRNAETPLQICRETLTKAFG